MTNIDPALIFIIAGLILPLINHDKLRAGFTIVVPIIALYVVWNLEHGTYNHVEMFDAQLTLMRVDRLSFIFGVIFCLAAALAALYAWHVNDKIQQTATLIYAGSAVGAVFAGDLITLFIFWEITAVASVFLIWARRTEGAFHTGMRYLIIQTISGMLLLTGTVLIYKQTGTVEFNLLTNNGEWSIAVWCIFFAFGIKCAFPLLHNWLQDSYPAATVTGTVTLSVFTTKLAVYAIARGFAGTEMLVYIGALMTLFPIFWAEVENDLRKVLAYSLNNQLGFMVVGIGIGTELALNGTAAHAFCHILYKALLFMSVGAVLFRTGTSKASELGGLWKSMPITMVCCIIGAASIAAFPLFSGFVGKSLIISATAKNHYALAWGVLVFASAGVMSHSGIRIPWCAFFSKDSKKRPKEAPNHMLAAMIIISALCIGIGIFPQTLYSILPYDVYYHPYTASHVLSQMELLCFALLAFAILKYNGVFPAETNTINLDTDWTYKKITPAIIRFIQKLCGAVYDEINKGTQVSLSFILNTIATLYRPQGKIAGMQSNSSMVLWIAILLSIALILSLLNVG